jgi:hypothetical protein
VAGEPRGRTCEEAAGGVAAFVVVDLDVGGAEKSFTAIWR